VFQLFQTYVASVQLFLDVCCKFFYLNVAKVDQMLHMLNETHLLQSPAVVAGASPSGQTVLTYGRTARETSEQHGPG
jgi:hypothetical protein